MNLTYEQYMIVFYAGIIASGVFLMLSIVLFILLKVPQTIGDLSGSNARKGIKEIRRQSEENVVRTADSGKKKSASAKNTVSTGELVNKKKHGGFFADKHKKDDNAYNPQINNAESFTSEETGFLAGGNETAVLDEESQTSVLTLENYAKVGYNGSDIGTVIADEVEYYGQTTVLGEDPQEFVQVTDSSADSSFSVTEERTLFFSDEIIA